MLIKIILSSLSILGLAFSITKTYKKHHTPYFFILLIIKILFGLFSGWMYFVYYETGDVLLVHKNALSASNTFFSSAQDYVQYLFSDSGQINTNLSYSGEARTVLFVKIISVLYLFSFQNFWLAGVLISTLSFCITIRFAYHIQQRYSIYLWAILISFMLIPSIGLWSSGIMKESITLPALLLIAILLQKKPTILRYVLAIILLYIVFVIKYYFMIPFVLLLIIDFLIRKYGFSLKSISLFTLLFLVSIALHPNLHLDKIYNAILSSYQPLISHSSSNSISFSHLSEGWWWMILYLPKAWYYGFLSPMPWDVYSTLSSLQSVQSLILSIIYIHTIYIIIKEKISFNIMAIVLLIYSFSMAGLLCYATPNIGSLSRYSVIYLPFVIMLCLNIILKHHESNKIS